MRIANIGTRLASAWPPGPALDGRARGNYTTRCSTYLTTDTSALNDTVSGSFTLQVHDAAVVSILAPIGTVPKNSVITPQVRISNNGSVRDSFNVILTIGAGYVDTVFATLDAGTQSVISFNNWIATPIGTHLVSCTTALAGDLITINDTLSTTVGVYDDDVGVVAILTPIGNVDSTAIIVPQCSVYNFGSNPVTFPGDVYDYRAGQLQ